MSDIISFQAPEPEDLSALLESYDINSLIAVGGMGAVYHATQTSLDREVAIKLLPKEFGDATFHEQFAAEARSMAKLNHPNLIGIYDYGTADGMPYIVMEYVPGKSLYYSCYQKAIEQDVAIRLTTEICSGLAQAHKYDIIHRDIKPANILLDSAAHAKIGDFGLASGSQESENDGLVYGTPGYAAPEILQDGSNIGKPSDIFAVGVILHQLLTGKMPDEDTRPASRISKCDPRLDRIIRKATRSNPADRYQTCEDMVKDLAAIGNSPAKKVLSTEPKAGGVKMSRSAVRSSRTESTPLKAAAPAAEKPKLRRLEPGSQAPTNSPAPDSPQEASQASPVIAPISTSSNWPLIRNLMIIALLIPALIFAWDFHQKKEARIAKQEEEQRIEKENITREAEATRAAAAREKEERRTALAKEKKDKAAQVAKIDKMVKAKPKLTPLEQLAKARTTLVGGSRDHFPEGVITRGNITLFFIETPMTWSAASEFCENHGGHLPTPLLASDLAWIGRQQGNAKLAWLGGGALGSAEWGWVTGEKWEHKKPSTNLGTCAAMTASGIVKSRPNGVKLPFFIQWNNDGTNPGSLEAQLGRLKGTLDAPSPAWPPGTLAYDGRNYLLIQRSLPWDEAEFIASSTGGHLAVASNTAEKTYLSDTLSSSLTLNESAWLGARLKEGNWAWVTGEVWNMPQWRKNSPDGGPNHSALRFTSAADDSGWDDANPENADLANAFIIEWSNDSKKAPAKDSTQGRDVAAEIKNMGAKLVRRSIADHKKLLIDNHKDLTWGLNSWIRGLPKSVSSVQGPIVRKYINDLPPNARVPKDAATQQLPGEPNELIKKALSRQLNYDNKLEVNLLNLRVALLGKLVAEKETLEKSNLKAKAAAIDTEIQAVGQGSAGLRAYFGISK